MELLALRSLAVSLLGEDLAMFWTRTPSEWPFFGLPAFSLAILVSLELISFLVFLALELATPAKSYVNPGGRLIQRRDCADFSCIWINKNRPIIFFEDIVCPCIIGSANSTRTLICLQALF
jgi:hypothetical protein